MQYRSEMQMQSRKYTLVFDKIPNYGQRAENVWCITQDFQNVLYKIGAIRAF